MAYFFKNKSNSKRFCSVNDVYELRIEKMVQGGSGLSHLPDGRVCFIESVLPGELCKVQLILKKKDFTRGRVLEIIESSSHRIKPKCFLYEKCGGCCLQHLSLEKQVEYLEGVERENFKRIAHINLPKDFKIHVGNAWEYRNRARIVAIKKRVGDNKDVIYFGFRMQESNQIALFKNCPILTKNLNEFLQGPARDLFLKEIKLYNREIDINIFDNGNGLISFYYEGMNALSFSKYSKCDVSICGKKIKTDASVFFQSNLGLLPKLVDSVCTFVDEGIKSGESSNEWLIDLFSGVGFFAVFLQDKFKRITTVERDNACLKYAKLNLSSILDSSDSVKHYENISAPAEDWIKNKVIDISATLIVDPPRTGLSKVVIDSIIESSVKRLIYVSCNPVTLARDYLKFSEAGFSLKKAEGFAFYPHTSHLEMMFVLGR